MYSNTCCKCLFYPKHHNYMTSRTAGSVGKGTGAGILTLQTPKLISHEASG